MLWLKKQREFLGLSMAEMGRLLKTVPQSYHDFETRAQGIKLETLCGWRKHLGISWQRLGELLDEEYSGK